MKKQIIKIIEFFTRAQQLANYKSHKIFVVSARHGIGGGRCGVCHLPKVRWTEYPCTVAQQRTTNDHATTETKFTG